MTDIGQQHTFFAGKIAALLVAASVTIAAPPEDADPEVTSRLDADGNSVLAPTLSLKHSADFLRGAELSREIRLKPDRHFARFALRRGSDDTARGMVHRIRIERRRAGEVGGIAYIRADVTAPENTLHDLTETTARLDADGHSLIPAEVLMRHAPDSLRAADLLPQDGTKQDRIRQVFAMRGHAAMVHRLRLERFRAGEAGGVRVLAVDAVTESRVERIPGPDSTGRLDADGNSVIPPELFVRHAPDSLRSADLDTCDGSKQDRHRQRFVVGWTAVRHRVRIERCRAGEAGGIRALVLDYAPVSDGNYRVNAEAS